METQHSKNLKDPVCGMDVTESSEHHHQHSKQEYCFFSGHLLSQIQR